MRTKNRDSEEWIDPAREGKLGEGFLTNMTFAEQKTALRRCVKKWGYRSCLGSVMVLNRNQEIREKYGNKIKRAKDWLMKEYGNREENPKKKISKFEAFELAKKIGIDFDKDFYEQRRSDIEELSAIAKLAGYRKPSSASGSLGRYFFEHLEKLKRKRKWNPCVRDDAHVYRELKKRRKNPEEITLHAEPYDWDASGFYFTSSAEYDEKAAANKNKYGKPVEEYEIQFIDGPDFAFKISEAMGLHQAELFDYFATVEELQDASESEQIAFIYLTDYIGQDPGEAMQNYQDVSIFMGTAEDYAYDLVEDIGLENLNNPDYYFDYERFGRDLRIEGSLVNSLYEDKQYYEDNEEMEEAEVIQEQIDFLEELEDEALGEYYVDSILGDISALDARTKANYVDYQALARDMRLGGDIVEIEREILVTNPYDF